MPRRGHDLVAPLKELLRAGRVTLPTIAGEYAIAANNVDRARGNLESVFRRPDYFSADPLGPVCGPWTALRDQIQGILAQTSVNLNDAGKALCIAEQAYEDTDTVAANEMRGAAKPVAVEPTWPIFPPGEAPNRPGVLIPVDIQPLPGFHAGAPPGNSYLSPSSGPPDVTDSTRPVHSSDVGGH